MRCASWLMARTRTRRPSVTTLHARRPCCLFGQISRMPGEHAPNVGQREETQEALHVIVERHMRAFQFEALTFEGSKQALDSETFLILRLNGAVTAPVLLAMISASSSGVYVRTTFIGCP
ncbi:hypothetical protein SAMN00790413_03606 [Deinococcus hopiensis KR-140]|uniref:Uncharacterized protein n=1 Tax=Deinococcus hopiensis KR-140 TaxID=695939 RepID=A0A1W1UXW5_9DEIO|nr:hypothetical protein SAMN00790413_03606 [Deinococcus hopiensis KR-140]